MTGSKGPNPQSEGQGVSPRSYQPVLSPRTGIDRPRVNPARRAPVFIPSVQQVVPGSRTTSELELTKQDIRGPSCGMIEGDNLDPFPHSSMHRNGKAPTKVR